MCETEGLRGEKNTKRSSDENMITFTYLLANRELLLGMTFTTSQAKYDCLLCLLCIMHQEEDDKLLVAAALNLHDLLRLLP